MSELLFYDIECFKHDSLVVFKDINNQEVAHFWSSNDPYDNGFGGIAELIDGKTLVGYNCHHYDDIVLEYMMRGSCQKTIKAVNDKIIGGARPILTPSFISLDCMQEIDVCRPSLKLIEGNLGRSILESSVPFDIDRKLTEEEKAEVLDYCRYDVESTIAVYKLRKHSYFDTKEMLLQLASDLPKRASSWNTTTISANILLKGQPLKRRNRLTIPEGKWKNIPELPAEVWSMWAESMTPDGPSIKKMGFHKYGCKIDFGFGGLHGVAVKSDGSVDKSTFRNVLLLDVGSMYPSMIVLLKAIGSSTQLYDQIRQRRLAVKHTDKLLANALKLILNSVYGNLKNRYSLLYDPLTAVTVCAYGQMALFDLSRRLYKGGYKLINLNTDGVAFVKGNVKKDWQIIQKEWEEEWKLYLELDEFKVWKQKDVNNYVAIKKDGSIKVKGGDVNKYHFDPDKGIHKLFSNNNVRVVHKALVDKLLFNKDIAETVYECADHPEMFQYVLRAGGTYKGVCDSNGNYQQKVNRIFAAKEDAPHTKLHKVRQDDGRVNFPDAPECMYLWNDDVSKIENFEQIIDFQHYIDIAQKRLEAWT